MNLPQRIRDHFPDATFGHPCSQSDVTRAEQALGEQLPKMLRELYLAFDGFRMPEGGGLDALLPLFGREGLVGMNAFFRNGAEFPTKLVSQCLFFGNDGIGGYWGFKRDLPGKIIRWDAEWGEDFEIDSDTPLDAWLAERRKYEELKELK